MIEVPMGRPFVRLAAENDVDALVALAGLAGGGMTNLPPDHDALAEKVAWSEASVTRQVSAPDNEFYMLVMEDGAGRIIGTASMFSRLGAVWPFYSYKLSRVAHTSLVRQRNFSTHVLHLVNDFDGATEVGGLFLHPASRSGGLGVLLARSRYLFIALHRERFADRLVAELRGWEENGVRPFWDAVAGPFIGGNFTDADLYNAVHGNQFIADLMPRYPIYITMLPEAARAAIGRPHPGSAPALRMLMTEGFIDDGYCDIFDGGPTVHARTETIRTIRECKPVPNGGIISGSPLPLRADGTGAAFRAWAEMA